MLEIKGNYTVARVYNDEVEEAAISQIYQICNQESMKDTSIAIMPDVHMGSGCCVGTTITIKDKVIPSLVGVDIGCGMEVVKLKEKHIEFARLDTFIHSSIPAGSGIRNKAHKRASACQLSSLRCYKMIDELRAEKSLGTLGGGNHFIEIDRDEEGFLYLILHSGSRHLGVEVATYYQKLAFDRLNGSSNEDMENLKTSLRQQGKEHRFSKIERSRKNTKRTAIPYLFSYLEGKDMEDYLHDLRIVEEFAKHSRIAMSEDIMKYMKLHELERFTTIHNTIDTTHNILRKGAISAQKGEVVLIPMNMRDGSLICVGKGNPDWNYSAPHGAGRLMSRGEAKQSFTLSTYKKEMAGIYTTSVNRSTLDECPMAYKDASSIQRLIQDSVEIKKRLKPVYNFKAGEE